MTIKSTLSLLPFVASTALGAGFAYMYWRGNRRSLQRAEPQPQVEGKTEAEALAETSTFDAPGLDAAPFDGSSGIYSTPLLDDTVEFSGLSESSQRAATLPPDAAADLEGLTTDEARATDRPTPDTTARMVWQDIIEVDVDLNPNASDEIDIDLLDLDADDDEYSALSPSELGAVWLARATQTRSTPPEPRDSTPELDPAGRPTDPDIEVTWPERSRSGVSKDVWGGEVSAEKEEKA